MEVKSVPWWRKALDFALSGIRSGFGLFSKAQKQQNETEPEIAAGPQENREEEAALTEHLPEQNSVVIEESPIEAVAAPDVETVAEPEVTAPNAHNAELQPEEELVSETEATDEAPAADPSLSTAMEDTNRTSHALAAEAAHVEVEPKPASALEFDAPAVSVAVDEPVTAIDETPEPVPEPAPEAGHVSVIEAANEESLREDSRSHDTEIEIAPEEELAVEQILGEEPAALEDAPAQQEIVETVEANEETASQPEVTTSEVTSADETIAKPSAEASADAETVTAIKDGPVAEEEPPAELTTETTTEAEELNEVAEAIVEPGFESSEASAELDPEITVGPETAADLGIAVENEEVSPVVEDVPEQVTEQQVTFENVSVDEVAPQAEAAISEDSVPESVSPVLDEMVEPVEPTPGETAPEVVAEIAEVVIDHAPGPIDEQATDQGIEVEQAVTEPMELNQPNSEPAAEQEPAADTTVPANADANPEIAAEENTAQAPEAIPQAAADEPEEPSAVTVAAQQPSKPFIKLEAREGEVNASPFSVIVSQVYDGPLDLLLDLIRKQDIDIYDIPIARITAQFLAYVDQLKATDVDVAGEFIYTASLLIHIKSKMLLPRAPSGPDDAAEDPRRELVERLLEHERFKNAAQMLQQKQMLEAATWTNPGMREFKEDAGAEPEIAADTVDLVRVFQDILERARNRPILNVEEDAVTVGQMIQFLSRRLTMEDKPIALRRLLSHTRSERALIAMFLALLELVRLQAILLRQDRAFCEIFVKKHSNFESVMNEAVTHDDWK
jgi:segregation and condensation protein A